MRNLWPQSTETSRWNSYVKDALERKLYRLVCAGELDLKTAQHSIASNWIEAYKKYVSEHPPTAAAQETNQAPAKPAAADDVWVNTRSGNIGDRVRAFTIKPNRASICPSWTR
jgi:hypothetical protein